MSYQQYNGSLSGGARRGLDRRERVRRVHDKRQPGGRRAHRHHVRRGRQRAASGQDVRQRRVSAGRHGVDKARDAGGQLLVQPNGRVGRRPKSHGPTV